ncbi:MAG: hypothetical protein IJX37_06230 [Oscillospiraceae bacterium]|nr:hypothetical protein [Oscillospiraceae bacterium]
MSLKQKNIFLILIILAMVLIYTLSGGSVGISLDFGEDALSVSAANMDWNLSYDQIADMKLTELSNVGFMVEGIDKGSLQCGTWQNEIWNEYTLCICPKLSQCIVLTQNDGSIFVLNYESDESTAALYNMFTELLQSKNLLSR